MKSYLPYFQPARETISPAAETKRPNNVAEPLDVKIRAIPNKDIEIPKSDRRIKTSPSFCYSLFYLSFFNSKWPVRIDEDALFAYYTPFLGLEASTPGGSGGALRPWTESSKGIKSGSSHAL